MDASLYRVHSQLELVHWWFVARRRIIAVLVRSCVPPGQGATIVDVGCGTGANIALLNREYHGVGIDIAEDAIRFARERFPQVAFICGEAPRDLGEVATQAKLFLLADVLEHVQDDRSLLTDLIMHASNGAYFLILVPANMNLWSEHDELYGHYRRYDRKAFCDLWKDLPVSTRLAAFCNSRLYPAVYLVRRFAKRARRSSGFARTDLWQPAPLVNYLLQWYFAGERHRLLKVLQGKAQGYRRGVTLIAILRRE